MFPSGYRRSNFRQVRYGAIALLLLASVVFHRSGPVYSVIRYAYLAVIVGYFALRIRNRNAGVPGRMQIWGSPAAPPGQPGALDGSLASPGWFPDPVESGAERYWSGTAWTKRRRFDGASWVEEVAPPRT